MTRKVCYVSGTRADFGLMRRTLGLIAADERLSLSICVTGMHLMADFGATLSEIEAAGFRIAVRVTADLSAGTGEAMARAVAVGIDKFTTTFLAERPDIVLLLGDRGEMLAGAIAAIHLNTPIAHLHGGERSGTVDEPIRHAISKLSHFHFVATAGARERLARMGEREDRIFVVGAPGLDGIASEAKLFLEALAARHGFDPAKPIALVVFHPVVQEMELAGLQMDELLTAAETEGFQVLCLMPNADAGYPNIRAAIARRAGRTGLLVATHLARPEYLSLLAGADMMLGNSSSGIIEAASFGLPVVNVGSRQDGRERSGNVVDSAANVVAIRDAIRKAKALKGRTFMNVYGNGKAGESIRDLLATLPLDAKLLKKSNVY